MAGYLLVGEAELDLDAILDHIADDSVESALRVHERFLEVFRLLAENPKAGHFRRDPTKRPVRFFPVYSYLVVYLTDTSPVEIVRILAMAQDAESILG
ncbi:MAG: type II toxin-antitoxin system RelE/ParE family toxin [Candidatus Krumholzibacteriia bacterium]